MPDINITNHVHAVKSWSMSSLAQSWPMQTNAIYCILFNTVFERRKKQIMWTQKLEFIDDVTKKIWKIQFNQMLNLHLTKSVNHKLNYYGIQGKTNTWIHYFWPNRTQVVLLEGEVSDYIPVMSDVSEDSVLGTNSASVLYYWHSRR